MTLRYGERVVLLGPNGAGKTTLIRILALSLAPSSGTIAIGTDDATQGTDPRRSIGLIGHRTGLYEDLSPRENLRLYGRLYRVRDLDARMDGVLHEVGATAVANAPVRTLSRGMQQRVGLARAILHEPSVLLMDEPDTGLDAQAQEWLIELIERWVKLNRAVLVATHHLEWAERIADRAIILQGGSMLADIPIRPGQIGRLAEAYQAAVRDEL